MVPLFQLGGIQLITPETRPTSLEQWINSETIEPFVNANMIELQKPGSSNRGRQNVASFLTKQQHIDWRWGTASRPPSTTMSTTTLTVEYKLEWAMTQRPGV